MRQNRRKELDREKAERAAKVAPVIEKLEAEKAAEEKIQQEAANDRPLSAPQTPVAPPVSAARMRPRHIAILLSFIILVVGPIGCVAFYMYARAADQYVSSLSYSVRTEEAGSALDFLGGLSSISSGSGVSDTDVLFEYLQSSTMVAQVNDEIGLFEMWNKPDNDPIFTVGDDPSIEAITEHWSQKINIFYDNSSNIIEIHAHAFTAEDSRLINQTILDKSSDLVNKLSSVAREDTISYARQDLELAVGRLKIARSAIGLFRSENQMLDPGAESQSQMGVLNLLQQQLATALIDKDMLLQATNESDPRVKQASTRITVIRGRIEEERRNFGGTSQGATGGRAYGVILEEFESLSVDKEFAEAAYLAALAAYNVAVAEAGRKTRYVAAHISPTLPERSLAPKRATMIGIFSIFNFLIWSIAVLVFYALRDRR